MNLIGSKLIGTGLFFLFIFISGFWLSRTGKPYSVLIQTIHKLVGVALGMYLIRTVYQVHEVAPLSPVGITAVVITTLFFCWSCRYRWFIKHREAAAVGGLGDP